MKPYLNQAVEYFDAVVHPANNRADSVSHHKEHLMELAQEQRNQMDDQTQDIKNDAAADYSMKMDM